MIISLHHIGIATRDLTRLAAFYMSHFNGEVLTTYRWNEDDTELTMRLGLKRSSGKLIMLGFPSGRLELFEFSMPCIPISEHPRSVAKPGLSHLCFQVSDCQAEYKRLLQMGMVFHAAPLDMPGGGTFAYGRDPDGNAVEILQIPTPDHPRSP